MTDRPRMTEGWTHEATIHDLSGGGDATIFMTTGHSEDGRLIEVFLQLGKHGSTMNGLLDWVAITISHALQAGVPLEKLVAVSSELVFPPMGPTDDPDIPSCTSVSNYVLRRLEKGRANEAKVQDNAASFPWERVSTDPLRG